MPIKSRLAYTKALIAALLACLASADAITNGAIGSVQAPDSLITKATHTPISVKRDLKANAAKITSAPTSIFEERTAFKNIPTVLAEKIDMIGPDIYEELKRLLYISWGDFLASRKSNLFESVDVSKWERTLSEDVHRSSLSKNKAFYLLHLILSEHYEDDAALVDALYAVLNAKDDWYFINYELKAQINSWMDNQENVASVFARLKIDQIPTDQLLVHPRSMQWLKFAWSIDDPEKWDNVYKILLAKHKLGPLVKVLVEGSCSGARLTYTYAELLLRVQLSNWQTNKIPEEDVFKFLTSLDRNDPSIDSPFVTRWLNYMKLIGMSRYEVLKVIQTRFPNVNAANLLE